ncbi:MAG: DUF1294 domain-containing protein [Clostridia bacterium]|nr:DUF1294 domain-containing protein [Clostridia bacterium]
MLYYLILYLITVSAVGTLLTVYDKNAARKGKRRVRESVLFLFALLGAAGAMYITMRLIRHKTLHKSFMYGFPLIILAHIALLSLYLPQLLHSSLNSFRPN